jgi:large subunit ribosomal protein L4
MAANVLTLDSAKQANITLVEGEKGHTSLYITLVALRAGRRQGSASTKNRSEVSGSGKKLWNQKGTGNARMGSRRSPIWKGGGVVFGPRPRDYGKDVNQKERRLALRRALTLRIIDGDILTVDNVVTDGKTKSFLAAHAGITTAKKVLYIGMFDQPTVLSARNLDGVRLAHPLYINAEDLLNFEKVVFTSEALAIVAKRTTP